MEEILKLLKQYRANSELVLSLIQKNQNIVSEACDDANSLLIHHACRNINFIDLSVVIYLLNICSNSIKHANNFGYLPIHKAVQADGTPNMDSIRHLIELYPQGMFRVNLYANKFN